MKKQYDTKSRNYESNRIPEIERDEMIDSVKRFVEPIFIKREIAYQNTPPSNFRF